MSASLTSRKIRSYNNKIEMENLSDNQSIYALNDNFIYYTPDIRHVSNFYSITSNKPHVFPFSVKQNGSTVLTISQMMYGMQDGSLVAWLSSSPLDNVLFSQYESFDPIPVIRSKPRRIVLWDLSAANIPPDALTLDARVTYYFNVKNNQAKANTYKLTFQ